MEQLLRGLYQAIRNPRSHGKVTDTEENAQAVILFIDYVLRIIGAARSPFTLQEYVARVLDKDFVATDRYARLLVDKLPAKYRLEVFHELFKRRTETKGDKLRAYFTAVLAVLTTDERREVSRTVSSELEVTNDDDSIRTAIDVLGEAVWKELDELPRMRIENKLLQEVRGGKYNVARSRCEAGALGTWTQSILADFGLKKELGSILLRKLESPNPPEREYVYQFFFRHLDALYETPPPRLASIAVKWLNQGDPRFKETFTSAWMWPDEEWGQEVTQALKDFESQAPTASPFDPDDNDLPF
jgi:hypothetical protein